MKGKSPVQMDLIANGNGFGPVATRLLANGMNVNVLKPWIGDDGRAYQTAIVNGVPTSIPIMNTATLRKDEWKQLDTAVIEVAQERLVGVADLISRGLTYNIPNGLGTTVLQYEDVSDLTDAEISMDAVTPSQRDRIQYDLKSLPLPIIHKDFRYNIRALSASRTTGAPLDVTTAQLASRKVMDKVETLLFQGSGNYSYGGGVIYGYTDYPYRNKVTLDAAWDASAKTGNQILDDCLEMKQSLIDAGFYGPYILYIPTDYETVLDDDYKSESERTIRERILAIDRIQDVKVIDKMPEDTLVMVQMTSDVVRMVEGLPVQTVEWQEGGGFTTNYKVLTIMVPQIRSDQEGNCGVCVMKTA